MSTPHPLLIALAAGFEPHNSPELPFEVVASAFDHRMHGLLWEWTEAGTVVAVPEIVDLLGPAVLAARSRSRFLSSKAAEISELLFEEDIEVAVFKGVAAEKRWYSGPGTRPAQDLDLWLSPNNLNRADEVLKILQPSHPLSEQIPQLVANREIRSVDLVWQGIPVDLHFDPFKFGVWYPDLNEVWNATEDLGDGYRAIGPAAELLNALIHLNKDRFSRLLGFVDVVRGSAQPEVAAGAWRLAQLIGVSVPVACSAQAVGAALGVDIPIPKPPTGWRTSLWSKLWPEGSWLQGSDGYRQMRHRQDLIPVLCDGHLPEAFKFLRHVWFPPRPLLDYFNPHVVGLPYPVALWKARTD